VTFIPDRKRVPAHQIVVGGLSRIFAGVFGVPTPQSEMDKQVSLAGFYHFHEGDDFTPGTGIWALDPQWDPPVNPVWGRGFQCAFGAFNPIEFHQVYANQNITVSGLGGLQHGQFMLPVLDIHSPEQG
jgi:hypothetical protein